MLDLRRRHDFSDRTTYIKTWSGLTNALSHRTLTIWRSYPCHCHFRTLSGRRTTVGALNLCLVSSNRYPFYHLILSFCTPDIPLQQGVAENDEIIVFVRVCITFDTLLSRPYRVLNKGPCICRALPRQQPYDSRTHRKSKLVLNSIIHSFLL